MRLSSAQDLGRYVRDRRRAAGLSQADLAARATVSRRWLSDLELGKPTVELGLVFKVTSALGLYVDCRPEPEPEIDLDAYLDSLGGEP
ncbi:helix-turn-helix domain-containing protein [Paractinoplanes globisporus]|uniref:Helix-turn-helix domain-containing protein n=1 Tax=Paractinoplanes globisporus TaxID=113565 RepID=A0ABW6WVU9_9ACTN|nr:helix-turn-helix domain-containing protein [Actinoplanes globisporus]